MTGIRIPGRDAVLFDLDGTLVDSREDILESFMVAARTLRGGAGLDEAAVAALIGRPLADMARRAGLDLPDAAVHEFETAYRSHYDRLGARRTRLFEGVPELLAALDARPTAIVTTKIQRQAEMVLARLGLGRRFGHVQGWAPGLRHKPDPQLVVLALEGLGVPPDRAVLVGDTAADVGAARAAGIAAVAVTWGFGSRAEIEAAAPTAIATSPGELVRILGG